MKNLWQKIALCCLLVYTVTAGLLFQAPRLPILNETIRNLHFHVPMWFGMMFLLTLSVVSSVRYLRNPRPETDFRAAEMAGVGFFFGILGILTGMIWANFTWGSPWSNDPKQNASAVALLIYAGYFLLRNSMEDPEQAGRVSAVYNIFAFALYIPLIFVLPRLSDSLHPGNGGNPGFNAYDLDSNLRWVFYPAVIAWAGLGYWIANLRIRLRILEFKSEEITD